MPSFDPTDPPWWHGMAMVNARHGVESIASEQLESTGLDILGVSLPGTLEAVSECMGSVQVRGDCSFDDS